MTRSKKDLNKAFQWITEGNAFEEKKDYWAAAHSFRKATNLLNQLAQTMTLATSAPLPAAEVDEKAKIAQLYQAQGREYLHRARHCFIKAVTLEQEHEAKRPSSEPPLATTLSEDQAQQRVLTFTSLFSKGQIETEEKPVLEKQLSLEERLMELNASLPSGFKTSDERMAEINRGLNRLGLSLYSEANQPSIDIPPQLSEDEQVAHIIAQAKDEIHVGVVGRQDQPVATENEISDSDDDDDSSIDVMEAMGNPRLRHRMALRRKIVKAQVKLTELVALLDSQSTKKKKVQKDDSEDDDDDDDDDESEDDEIDIGQGLVTLRHAQKYLNQARKDWDDI